MATIQNDNGDCATAVGFVLCRLSRGEPAIAPITRYFNRWQIEEWFARDFADVHISSLNRMSWRATGAVGGTPRDSG
jgi:hypothetical protein